MPNVATNSRAADREEVLAALRRQGRALVEWRPLRLFGRPLRPHERLRLRRALADLAAAGEVALVRQYGRRLSHVLINRVHA